MEDYQAIRCCIQGKGRWKSVEKLLRSLWWNKKWSGMLHDWFIKKKKKKKKWTKNYSMGTEKVIKKVEATAAFDGKSVIISGSR